MAVASIMLDLVVIGLLVATIAYSVQLSRRLSKLRDGRAELEEMIKGFAEATSRAEASVKGLRKVAAETGETLQGQIERAQTLRDEMHFMLEVGDILVARLEGAIGNGRTAAAQAAPAAHASGAHAPGASGAAIAETAMTRKADPRRRPPAAPLIERDRGDDPAQGTRSRAERELLQAIKRMR